MPRSHLRRPLAVAVLATIGLTLGGCAESPDAASPDDAASRPPSAAHETVRVRLENGEITSDTPSRVAVSQGDTVRIAVRSDASDGVHVHGYDEEIEVEPGKPATLDLTADQTGLFEVETHESGLLLFQLLVR
ncbi:MAG: hypothetical protein ACRDYU_03310 [Actinomycetes bacterium]